MGIPRLFKLPKHKQFNYQPLYYDERKEQLEERIKRIENEMGVGESDGTYKRTLGKGSFTDHYQRKRKTQRYSTTRLIIIIIFLIFICYFLFYR